MLLCQLHRTLETRVTSLPAPNHPLLFGIPNPASSLSLTASPTSNSSAPNSHRATLATSQKRPPLFFATLSLRACTSHTPLILPCAAVLRRHYRSRSAPLPLSISVGMRNGGMVVKQRETRKCKLDRQSEEHPAVASPKPRGVRPWWALRSYQEMDEDAHRKRSKEVASTSGTHPLSCRCGKLSDATAQVARKESSVRAVSHFHSKSELLVSKQPEGPTPRVCEAAHDRESCRV